MYQTIQLSSCVSVQGDLVELLADGRAVIRVGAREFRGRPVLTAERRAPLSPAKQGVVEAVARRARAF